MKYALVILLHCLLAGRLMAQADTVYTSKSLGFNSKDTTLRKYLVCETRWAVKPSVVFEDGMDLEVWDTMGEHREGELKVLNAEFIELESKGHKDTIHISAVYKIKKIGVLPRGPVIGGFIVATAVVIIFPPAAIPLFFLLRKQNNYKHWDYHFRIIQTEGFKLKKSDIKYLQTNN